MLRWRGVVLRHVRRWAGLPKARGGRGVMCTCAPENWEAAVLGAGAGLRKVSVTLRAPTLRSFHLPSGITMGLGSLARLFSHSSPGQMRFPSCSWVISGSLEVHGLGRHPTPACLGRWQLCPGSQAKLKQFFLFSLDERCRQRGCTGRDPKPPECGDEQGETR